MLLRAGYAETCCCTALDDRDSSVVHLLQQLRKQRGARAQPRRTSVVLYNHNEARAAVDAIRVHY